MSPIGLPLGETEQVPGLRGELATEAYLEIRGLIVRGRLAPGARLVETELARRLELSRTPVRAALERLRQEGYVQEASGGSRSRLVVAPLTKEDGTELYFLLGEIDGLAAYFAAQLEPSSRGRLAAELRALNADLKKAADEGQTDGNVYFDLDDRFHRRYREAGGRPRVRAYLDAIKPQAERYIRVYTRAAFVREIPRSARDHDAIVDAIEAGDPPCAQQAARTNFRNAADRLLEVIDAMGEWGSW